MIEKFDDFWGGYGLWVWGISSALVAIVSIALVWDVDVSGSTKFSIVCVAIAAVNVAFAFVNVSLSDWHMRQIARRRENAD